MIAFFNFPQAYIIGPDGKSILAAAETIYRGNRPVHTIWHLLSGRRLTPYEMRLRGWKVTYDTLLQLYITPELMQKAMNAKTSFWNKIPKDTWTGSTFPVPFKVGEEFELS